MKSLIKLNVKYDVMDAIYSFFANLIQIAKEERTIYTRHTSSCMLPVSLYAHKAWAALLLEHATSSLLGIDEI